uniref:F-box domain-containing protein n=1 Tax=Setaria italica TaxID=4555 RepID=K3ZE98_SETIT
MRLSKRTALLPQLLASIAKAVGEDRTTNLPEELLTLIFDLLSSDDPHATTSHTVPGHRSSPTPCLLSRFPTISKLALKCDRGTKSVGYLALTLITNRLGPSGLRRLKLHSLHTMTDDGVAMLTTMAANLQMLSVGSCTFEPRELRLSLLLPLARGALHQAPPQPR